MLVLVLSYLSLYHYLFRTAVCVFIHACSVWFHYTAACMVYDWGKTLDDISPAVSSRGKPLVDFFHTLPHPNERVHPVLYKLLNKTQSVIFMVPACILVYHSYFSHGFEGVCKTYRMFSICHTALLFMRSVSFSLTLLPDVTQEFKKPKVLRGGTHDLIFSGHTVFGALPMYICAEQCLFIMVLLNILNTAGIIWCRRHYSVDVWLAHILTFFVFHYVSMTIKMSPNIYI